MKALVLLGEGHGEVEGLPILVRRLLEDIDEQKTLYVDKDVIRTHSAASLVTWDKQNRRPDFSEWVRFLKIAARRRNAAAVLAVFDGDEKRFPAGGPDPLCVCNAAKAMAHAAAEAGASRIFSLAVVFACTEYESWLVAGAGSLVGKRFDDGRIAVPAATPVPTKDFESYGKGWFQKHMEHYRPARDQGPLTKLVDLQCVRDKNIRSFGRLENGIRQILDGVRSDCHKSTPA